MLATAFLGAFGLDAANAQTLALAQRVKAQAHVLPNPSTLRIADGPRLFGDITIQKVPERPLTDKADASRVFFLCVGQSNVLRHLADLGFVQLTNREQGFGQLRLVKSVQEVALVLRRVKPLEQFV